MDIEKKLDAYEMLTPEEQITLGKALWDLKRQKGWPMFEALLRRSKANLALASLSDKELSRDHYAGMVRMIDVLFETINTAVANAEAMDADTEEGEEQRARVLSILRPGQGVL